mmetsp:Transcript_9763/g.25230  ORF Transcript_9763/g.25230 Transcript_9763/m.25230 type:complete len:265 (-) Transcript_9763:310-1104(-)
MEHDLVIDPAIRDWVFIPIVLLMFFMGILRHNVTILLKGEGKAGDKVVLKQTMDLVRSRRLRANCKQIPYAAFAARRQHFNHPESGVFAAKIDSQANAMAMLSDPDMMQNMMKGNMAMMVPQVFMMGIVNYFFSGFVLVKIPFPLTPSFKTMLQRGIPLASLDVSYVTSLSWYFLVMFGMRGLFQLVLGDNQADDAVLMQQSMGGAPGGGGMPGQPVDNKKNFEAEKENLTLTEHKWAVENAEELLLGGKGSALARSALKQKNL